MKHAPLTCCPNWLIRLCDFLTWTPKTSTSCWDGLDTKQLVARRVCHYKSADWHRMHTFYSSHPCEPDCFSSDDPSGYAAVVTDVVRQGIELQIPSSVGPIRGKSMPWFNTSCTLVAFGKSKAYHIWAETLVTKNTKVKALKRQNNTASMLQYQQIIRARSEYIA